MIKCKLSEIVKYFSAQKCYCFSNYIIQCSKKQHLLCLGSGRNGRHPKTLAQKLKISVFTMGN